MIVERAARAADRGGGARLPRRLGLEGISGERQHVRHRTAARGSSRRRRCPTPIFTPATKAAPASTMRTSASRQVEQLIGAPLAARGARHRARSCIVTPASTPRARGIIIADTKFEFGARPRRHADADRRGADARLLALLAGRHLARRHQPAVFRQAVRARLSRDAALGQAAAGAAPAARRSSRRTAARSTRRRCGRSDRAG